MKARVVIYVQHLLGTGHLRRAALLAKTCSGAGFTVRLVSGGFAVPDLDTGAAELVQLEPVRCREGDFSALLDAAGAPVDEAFKARRRRQLLAAFDEARPDALIVEMYPFGRRQMRFELEALIERARNSRPKPLIVASVRDILQTGRRPGRNEEAARIVERDFDAVLVHGDPGFAPFAASFPPADRIAGRLHHTGYLAEPLPAPARQGDAGWNEVVVSAGGGAVGGALLRVAIAARPLSSLKDRRWRLLTGSAMAADERRELAKAGGPGVVIEPARPDFARLLSGAAVSVSQGGYNTVTDILNAGVRAVIVPFAGSGETEQTMRAGKLAERGLAVVLPESDLNPENLARTVGQAHDMPPAPSTIDMSGAASSVRLLAGWLAKRAR
ncbi:MAG: glycosyltransferase family protein [Alphaproteobacteria bacterium]